MFIQSIIFRRNSDSDWEAGLYISETEHGDNSLILDECYKSVENTFEFLRSVKNPMAVSFPFKIGLDQIGRLD